MKLKEGVEWIKQPNKEIIHEQFTSAARKGKKKFRLMHGEKNVVGSSSFALLVVQVECC